MNKIIIFISLVLSVVLMNSGISSKTKINDLKKVNARLLANNLEMKRTIKIKESIPKKTPMSLSMEYSVVLNQIRLLESYSGTSMNVQLDGATDTQDISSHYENTEYRDIKGLKIKIVVDQFLKETDMGAVLDDIHLLEKNTDFIASEISMNGNNLIVKGEIYGS